MIPFPKIHSLLVIALEEVVRSVKITLSGMHPETVSALKLTVNCAFENKGKSRNKQNTRKVFFSFILKVACNSLKYEFFLKQWAFF